MIKWKLLKNIVLVSNQSFAVTKGESFYRSVKGCQTVARFFFIHESCFGNIKRGPFISEAEKHIKPICFRNFLTIKLCYQGHIFHFSIRLLRQSSDFFFHFEKMVWSDFFYYEKKWNHEKTPFKSIIFFTFEPLISHRLSLAFCHIYTVNNYRQVTGMTTGENFAFFIYRHIVEIL